MLPEYFLVCCSFSHRFFIADFLTSYPAITDSPIICGRSCLSIRHSSFGPASKLDSQSKNLRYINLSFMGWTVYILVHHCYIRYGYHCSTPVFLVKVINIARETRLDSGKVLKKKLF